MEYIKIKGAKENNLKNVDVLIPRDKFVVITGLSGSGKSSLAFDTIYAEGQRRYVESLSAYARQFLGLMEKPNVEYIEGLSPAISIDQKTTSKNPRSTVVTVNEIYDYLRLLYARIGHPHCPNCGKPITQQSVDQITDSIMSLPSGSKIQVLAPVIRGKKGEHVKVFEDARKNGFVRARVDGEARDLADQNINKRIDELVKVTNDQISQWDKAEANVQADWNETDNTKDSFILNKPDNLVTSDQIVNMALKSDLNDVVKLNSQFEYIPSITDESTGEVTEAVMLTIQELMDKVRQLESRISELEKEEVPENSGTET